MSIINNFQYTHCYSDKVPKLLLSKYIDQHPFHSLLDAGCGDGSLLYALNKKKYFDEKIIYAIDISQNNIDLCKQIDPNFQCFVNSACDMKDIADGSINFLISTQVIEHVPIDEDMIKEIERALDKKQNIVYLSTIFKKWYGWYFYKCNNKWTLHPEHCREYTADNQLLDLLKKYNFNIIESKKSLLWFPISHFFLRRIGNKHPIINNFFFKFLCIFKVPIIGYYNWEIVFTKN